MTISDTARGGAAMPPIAASQIDEHSIAELRELMSRYPEARSALIPMLHLVHSVDGYVSDTGVQVCAELLGITSAEVLEVATFYTMFKRRPAGKHHIAVCRSALCAVLGGDIIWDEIQKKLAIADGETTPNGMFSLEGMQCAAACDFAPVVSVDWEFMDNMSVQQVTMLLDMLDAGQQVYPTRGAMLTGFRAAHRVLAGFPDEFADAGASAGEASMRGVRTAAINGWTTSAAPLQPSVGSQQLGVLR
ncbi:MAG: NAD(P)H-dependent oxidoreductase subunit E [Propionibacteriaceae bacterium]|jgi:NADH-quinone oxidoreductase subunit E|nr:NAD(P)H-dependent oxidoreductase subunit E [Propionibacteriaceae bacterium]